MQKKTIKHLSLFFFATCITQTSLYFSADCTFQKYGFVDSKTLIEKAQVIVPWKSEKFALSDNPPLMGCQMGRVITPGIEPLGYVKEENGTKVFHLIVQPVEKVITDGIPADPELKDKGHHEQMMHKPVYQKLRGWGVNGSITGPTIEITEGDHVKIMVKNELPEPTSIHWHGLEIPNSQDGAAPTTQKPILPGETFTYEFTVYQSGTFMYHSGFNVAKQDPFGIGGFFISHPKDTPLPDKDFAIMLNEWALAPNNIYPNLMTMEFNFFTFNALAAPNIPVLRVKQGDRVRIRFGSIASMNSHPIHIHGYAWTVVGTEGGPIKESAQWKGATITVAPGTTRDVEFTAWNPGLWRLHCHKLHHVMNMYQPVPLNIMPHGGMFTFVHVEPTDPATPWRHPKQTKEVYSE